MWHINELLSSRKGSALDWYEVFNHFFNTSDYGLYKLSLVVKLHREVFSRSSKNWGKIRFNYWLVPNEKLLIWHLWFPAWNLIFFFLLPKYLHLKCYEYSAITRLFQLLGDKIDIYVLCWSLQKLGMNLESKCFKTWSCRKCQ